MIAIDTNVLVHSHRSDSPFHERAATMLGTLITSGAPWAIPWPSVHEFLSVVTHPRIWRPPTPLRTALDAVEAWLASPSLVMLAEADGYMGVLSDSVMRARIVGPRIHDARIASLCALHGVTELWTADRDFHAFPDLSVKNPLV